MSNEEIPVGSRWRWPVGRIDFTVREVRGDVAAVQFDDGHKQGWHLSIIRELCTRIDGMLKRTTRIDAPPAVKVGDIVHDPELLAAGMMFTWEGIVGNLGPHRWEGRGIMLSILGDSVRKYGVRVVGRPEPTKAEAPLTAAVCSCGLRHSGACPELGLAHAVRCCCIRCRPVPVSVTPSPVSNGNFAFRAADRMPEGVSVEDEPERCAPGCTPAAPCRTEGVCPVFAEEEATAMTEIGVWNKGIASEWPPPARRHTPPPLRHEGACIAGWNGRVPRG